MTRLIAVSALTGTMVLAGAARMAAQEIGASPIYYSGANVGIGTSSPLSLTSSPQSTVNVNGAGIFGTHLSNDVILGASSNDLDANGHAYNGLGFYTVGNTSVISAVQALVRWNDLQIYSGSFSVVPNQNTTAFTVQNNGNVGIGTTSPQYPLSVNGIVQAKEVLVNTGWSDYVFEPGYRLAPLTEVSAYVQEHHHLPEIPSASEVAEKGISVGKMQAKLLAKIEELTLHMIHTEQENRELKERLQRVEQRMPQPQR